MALPKLEHPTYTVKLPSNGKEVVFRPFLVKEYKILLTLAEAEKEEVVRIVKDLINACTFGKVDVNELPHFDIEYLFLQLRAKSISEVVNVVVTCDCEEKLDASFNIEDLQVENNKKLENRIQLDEEIGVELKFLDFDTIVKLAESDDVDDLMDLVTNSIKGVFTKDTYYEASQQSKEEIVEFLTSLNKDQFKKIEDYIKESPRVVQKFSVKCDKCENVNKISLIGIENFFV